MESGAQGMATIAARVTTESRSAAGDHPPKSTVHVPAGYRVGRRIGSLCKPVSSGYVPAGGYRSNGQLSGTVVWYVAKTLTYAHSECC